MNNQTKYWQTSPLPNLRDWNGIALPEFRLALNTVFRTFEHEACEIPLCWSNEGIEQLVCTDDSLKKPCLDLTWEITGSSAESQAAFDEALNYANVLIFKLDATKFHFAKRWLLSTHPLHRKQLDRQWVPRFFMLRIYLNSDFDCIEHPEMLVGKPIGMYHCPECGAMQVGGMPHIRDAMLDEYRASEV
ncbi:hypothetical protein D3C85_736810 [compost metagenome]